MKPLTFEDPPAVKPGAIQDARVAVDAYMHTTSTDGENAVRDLLADLMHYCEHHGIDFDHEAAVAARNYREERE